MTLSAAATRSAPRFTHPTAVAALHAPGKHSVDLLCGTQYAHLPWQQLATLCIPRTSCSCMMQLQQGSCSCLQGGCQQPASAGPDALVAADPRSRVQFTLAYDAATLAIDPSQSSPCRPGSDLAAASGSLVCNWWSSPGLVLINALTDGRAASLQSPQARVLDCGNGSVQSWALCMPAAAGATRWHAVLGRHASTCGLRDPRICLPACHLAHLQKRVWQIGCPPTIKHESTAAPCR